MAPNCLSISMDNKESIKSLYESAGQGHVFKFWNELNSFEKTSLLDQLSSIDPIWINKCFFKAMNSSDKHQDHENLIPPIVVDVSNTNTIEWWNIGLDLIRNGKVAALTLAGGQGTRLGSTLPKGCFDIGLPSHKSLFHLQAERIKRLQNLSCPTGSIYWYLMTSEPTHIPTIQFFKQNSYFGLSPEYIIFFQQSTIPSFDENGKFILESKSRLSMSPDGNGGMYLALMNQGILKHMKEKNIEHLHVYSVDNVLVRIADPVFIGYCSKMGFECGSKVIEKKDPSEPVGILCQKQTSYRIVEYTEMNQELVHKVDPISGKLSYRHANIANHYFSRQLLERIANGILGHELELVHHIARKKISYIDLETGDKIAPTKTNGIKLEQFIFDVFPFIHSMGVLQVSRSEEFSPVKNAAGSTVDSPNTAKADIMNLHKEYLTRSGAYIRNLECECEISPLITYAGEGLEQYNGKEITLPLVLE